MGQSLSKEKQSEEYETLEYISKLPSFQSTSTIESDSNLYLDYVSESNWDIHKSFTHISAISDNRPCPMKDCLACQKDPSPFTHEPQEFPTWQLLLSAIPGCQKVDDWRSWVYQKTQLKAFSKPFIVPQMDPEQALILEPVPQYEIQCLTMDEVASIDPYDSFAPKRDIFGEVLTFIPGGSRIQSLRYWIREKSDKDLVPIANNNSSTPPTKSIISDYIATPFHSCIANTQSHSRAAQERLKAATKLTFFSDIKHSILNPVDSLENVSLAALCCTTSGANRLLHNIGESLDTNALKLKNKLSAQKVQTKMYPLYKYRDMLVRTTLVNVDNTVAFAKRFPLVRNVTKRVHNLVFKPTQCKGASLEKLVTLNYVPGSPINRRLSFSFSGNSTHPMYEIGAAQCFKDHIRSYILDDASFMGSSSGALVAMTMALDLNLHTLFFNLRNMTLRYSSKRFFGSYCGMEDLMKEILEEMIPEELDLETGRLRISLTRFPQMTLRRIDSFYTKQDLVEVLMATLCMPLIYNSPLLVGKKAYVSGNLSDPLPVLDDFTITVSSRHGEATISPAKDTFSWVGYFGFDQSSEMFTNQYNQGYHDTRDYLERLYETGELSTLFFQKIPRPESQS